MFIRYHIPHSNLTTSRKKEDVWNILIKKGVRSRFARCESSKDLWTLPTNFYGFSKQRRIIVEHVEGTCVRKIAGWKERWKEGVEKIECEQQGTGGWGGRDEVQKGGRE